MILTLQDLLEHSQNHAKRSPLIAAEVLISAPGLNQEELDQLIKHFPTLPKSYLDFIKQYDVKQVTIGGYDISPCSNKQQNMATKLLEFNQRDEAIEALQQKHDLIMIATANDWEDIYVAGTQSDYKKGEILMMDHELYWEDEVPIVKVAPNYEMFLIVAGNKYQIQLSELSYEESQAEMKRRLDALKLDPEYREYWVR